MDFGSRGPVLLPATELRYATWSLSFDCCQIASPSHSHSLDCAESLDGPPQSLWRSHEETGSWCLLPSWGEDFTIKPWNQTLELELSGACQWSVKQDEGREPARPPAQDHVCAFKPYWISSLMSGFNRSSGAILIGALFRIGFSGTCCSTGTQVFRLRL